MLGVIRYLVKKFYILCAIVLIALAVVVQLGRSFSHLANDYHQELASYLSGQLNAEVEVEAIEVQWEGLKPVLDAFNVRVSSREGEQIVALEHARLRLDLLSSLGSFRPVWGTLTLDGAQLAFYQNDYGRWGIAGLPESEHEEPESDRPAVPTAVQIDNLYDVFLLGHHVEFQRSQLMFHFADDHSVELFAPSLLLESSGSFHRLSLQVDIDDRPGAIHLVLEGEGDPRNRRQFRSRGYLQLREFPTTEPLAAVGALLFDGVDDERWRTAGTLDTRLWFNRLPQGEGYDLTGQLLLQGLPLSLPLDERQSTLHRLQTQITGQWLRNGDWQLALQDLSLDWDNSSLADIELAASYRGREEPLRLQLARLNLETWSSELHNDLQLRANETLQNVFASLNPRGELRRVQLQLPLDNFSDWQLEANLDQVAVDSWNHVPALAGVDGFVRADRRGGIIDLDSRHHFTMYFDQVYAEPMHYQRARGQVAWWLWPEQNRIYVNSGPLRLQNRNEDATGYMWLSLPWESDTGDTDLYLHIGGRNMTADLQQKYVPQVVPSTLRDWLSDSIGTQNTGLAKEAGFIFRGTVNAGRDEARSYQLYLDIEDAQLRYHPEWPVLRNLGGRLLVDDNRVDAQVRTGRLYNSDVRNTRVVVDSNPRGEGMLLRVSGSLDGIASDGLRVLRETLLGQYVGDNLDDWYLHGTMQSELEIAVPLQSGEPGMFQQLAVDIDAPTLTLANYNLDIEQVRGRLYYSSVEGFSSESLRGTLFGEPLQVDISSSQDSREQLQTIIALEGAAASAALAEWSGRPELLFLDGILDYSGRIELTQGADRDDDDALVAALSFTSDLSGVGVDLPDVYGKTAEESRPLRVNYILGQRTGLLDIRYHDLLHGVFQLQREPQQLLNASLALHDQAILAPEPQLLLSGYLPSLQMDVWQEVAARYSDYARQLGDAPEDVLEPLVTALPLRLSIVLEEHQLGALRLEDIRIDAQRDGEVWQLDLFGEVLAGRLLIPPDDSQEPLQLSLEYLHLTREALGLEDEAEATPDDELSAEPFDPRQLPAADIEVAWLTLDGDDYGDWSFQMRPDEQGLLVEHLRASLRGLTLTGQGDAPGATLRWWHDDSGQRTEVSARVQAGNMAEVLLAWEQPDILDSRSASYSAQVAWPGAPHQFALSQLQGRVDLDLQEGRFRRDPSAGDGILRLLSLLNFDSLARRLRLDFSDLYQSGLAYDRVRGQVRFADGMMYFDEPLQVRSPSSRMQLGGSVDLREETIDARLVATLPVASNLTFLAALAAGLPTAVGVYVVSKLFEKQVDQATSVTYTIRGDWDNPQMRFDRLFESDANLRSGNGSAD